MPVSAIRGRGVWLVWFRCCGHRMIGMDNATMSQSFQAGDSVLWNPSTGVARLFARHVEAVASAVDVPTGLGPEAADEFEIDLATFNTLIDALVRRYCSSTHPLLHTLIDHLTALDVV